MDQLDLNFNINISYCDYDYIIRFNQLHINEQDEIIITYCDTTDENECMSTTLDTFLNRYDLNKDMILSLLIKIYKVFFDSTDFKECLMTRVSKRLNQYIEV